MTTKPSWADKVLAWILLAAAMTCAATPCPHPRAAADTVALAPMVCKPIPVRKTFVVDQYGDTLWAGDGVFLVNVCATLDDWLHRKDLQPGGM